MGAHQTMGTPSAPLLGYHARQGVQRQRLPSAARVHLSSPLGQTASTAGNRPPRSSNVGGMPHQSSLCGRKAAAVHLTCCGTSLRSSLPPWIKPNTSPEPTSSHTSSTAGGRLHHVHSRRCLSRARRVSCSSWLAAGGCVRVRM